MYVQKICLLKKPIEHSPRNRKVSDLIQVLTNWVHEKHSLSNMICTVKHMEADGRCGAPPQLNNLSDLALSKRE